MGLIAYKCLECGHYTISKYDGKRCAKCDRYLVPYDNATCVDKSKSMKVEVSIKDIDLFKGIINGLKELLINESIPEEVKTKIEDIIK